ncbi:MAG: ribosome small subunit-dependent GTPase A [Planctomycetaceae bacterium]
MRFDCKPGAVFLVDHTCVPVEDFDGEELLALGRKPSSRKVRVSFRKNRQVRVRRQNLTHDTLDNTEAAADLAHGERLSGKGALTRQRTIIADADANADDPRRAVDEQSCVTGRVLRAVGANHCLVQLDDGGSLDCVVRRVVRTMARDARNAVVAGDKVLVLPQANGTGVIERVEPRRTTISRGSGRHEHVIVANVDQALIVVSADEPPLKPALIDRFLVSAGKGNVHAIVCISKVDLVESIPLQSIAGIYARIGYDVVLTSAVTGQGVARLRELLSGRETVLTGQSGVGKSSLINGVLPELELRTSHVSSDGGKGRHTTRVAELLPLAGGGWIVDTPGIRQMQLWDVANGEVEGYFLEFRPFVPGCRFPDCLHTHEQDCAVKQAVADGLISELRYMGYLRIVLGE